MMAEGWSTKNEIQFIRGIGTHTGTGMHIPSRERMSPRLEFLKHKLRGLRGYLKGAELRVNWGHINKASVVEFAYEEISRTEEAIDKELNR
jgi:hypothetical protein